MRSWTAPLWHAIAPAPPPLGAARAAHAIPDVVDAPLPPISVAMGVLVAPSAHAQRQAVRQTSLKSRCVSKTPAPGRVLMRFVVEERTDARCGRSNRGMVT